MLMNRIDFINQHPECIHYYLRCIDNSYEEVCDYNIQENIKSTLRIESYYRDKFISEAIHDFRITIGNCISYLKFERDVIKAVEICEQKGLSYKLEDLGVVGYTKFESVFD